MSAGDLALRKATHRTVHEAGQLVEGAGEFGDQGIVEGVVQLWAGQRQVGEAADLLARLALSLIGSPGSWDMDDPAAVQTAYEAAKARINLDDPARSRFVERLRWGLDEGRLTVRRAAELMGMTVDALHSLFVDHDIPVPFDL